MKKIKKLLTKLFALLLILIAIACLLFVFFGESAIKLAIETGATKALHVGVNVDDVSISLLKGEFAIKDLDINNPAGYQNPNFLELDTAMVKADMKTLLAPEVRINKVHIDGIKITIEQKGLTSNIADLTKPMSESKPEDAEPDKEKAADEDEKADKKVVIDELEITNITVAVKLLPIPGKADTVNLKLMPIKLTDVGKDKSMDIAQTTELIVMKITQAIAQQGSGIIPEDMVNSLHDILSVNGEFILQLGNGILQNGNENGQKLKEGLIKSTEDVTNKAKETLESLGNIFKDKKEEEKE